EHGLVLRPGQPRRGDQDHGGGEQAQAGRRGEVLRFPAQERLLREDRQGLQDQDGRAAQGAQGSRRRGRLDRRGTLRAAGRDAADGLSGGVEGVVVEREAQSAGARLPRLYLAGVLSVLGGLLIWELVSRFLVANALFLAAPSQIFAAIAALARSGELWLHMRISAIEFALGYVIASVLGVATGFAMA